MNLFLTTLLATLALTQANVDWSKVRPGDLDHPLIRLLTPVKKGSSRITGGDEVVPHSLPHQVALRILASGGDVFCGGSLVSPSIVLTAAHCAELSDVIVATFGAHNIGLNEETQINWQVDQVIIHPGWDADTLSNDIAILTLPGEMEINENIQTVNLPTRADASNNFAGDIATASGWGKDSDGALGISRVLRSVDVPVLTNDACNGFYGGVILPTHLCTDGADGKSTCSGDSGGPLVDAGKLIGVTSFGVSLGCEVGYPAAFTRVTEYLDWIEENSGIIIG